jgi:hypothetical protein
VFWKKTVAPVGPTISAISLSEAQLQVPFGRLHLHVFALFAGEVRSCSPAENAQQARHPLGCGRTSLSETVFCLCDTDLCNNSPPLGSSSLFLLPICLLLSPIANLSL